MTMEIISSRNNKWIKQALQLKQKKFRDRYGMFLMEGLRSSEDAINQEIRDCVCLIQREQLANERVQQMIEAGEKLHWLFLSPEDGLMELISGTEHGQGIILLVHKKQYKKEDLLMKHDGYYVLLDEVQDPGNMGTILRTSAAAGADGVLLTKGCTDVYAEKAVRSSMGSILRIPVYENIELPFVEAWKEASGLPLYGTALQQARPYKEIGDVPCGIFMFGNEGNGIRQELLSMADQNLYIPLAGTVESLNVSVACAVILFHFIPSR